jgi:hypothetical protein
VRTDGELWIVDERTQRRAAAIDALGFQSVQRGQELAVSTASDVHVFRRTGPFSLKQVDRMRSDGWVKHVGATASGWVFTEVIRERKAVLTSPDLRRLGSFDVPSTGTWAIASFPGGSILYNHESPDAWVVRSASDVRQIRWSGAAPFGEVAAARNLDSLWLTNGTDVHRPVSERVVPVHAADTNRSPTV